MLSFLDDLQVMLSAAAPKEDFDSTSFEEGVDIVIRWATDEILSDVRKGIVPMNVPDFSALHDYVDANLYGGADYWPNMPSETDDERYVNDFCRFWNTVQGSLDAWIKAGGIASRQIRSTGKLTD
jgi:hypothetical protein